MSRLGDVPVPVGTLWNPALCPVALLPWLAHALAVPVWDAGWSEAVKRQVLALAGELNDRRGTRWAVLEALSQAGFEPESLVEGEPLARYDGTFLHNGSITYSAEGQWARNRLTLLAPEDDEVTTEQLVQVRRIFVAMAPARSELSTIELATDSADQVALEDAVPGVTVTEVYFFDGSYDYDGGITYEGGDSVDEVWA